MHRLIGLVLLLLLVPAGATRGEVRLPRLFGDNMVIQRDRPAPVWGWATPGEQITVSFAGQAKTATARADGRWQVTLDPLPADDQGRDLMVRSDRAARPVRLGNVVVGDVWLCAGDFGAYWQTYACLEADLEVPAARYPSIRLLSIADRTSNTPLDDIEGQWMPCSPTSVTSFSALGYFFARALHRELNIPIGVIDAAYRYSFMRSFLPPAGLQMVPELKAARERMESWDSTTDAGRAAFSATVARVEAWLPVAEAALRDGTPIPPQPLVPAPIPARDTDYGAIGELSVAFHGMIAPLIPFAVRGALWSQGENGAEADLATAYLRAISGGWRRQWGHGEFPFYIELLPAVGKACVAPGGSMGWVALREAQWKAASAIANSGAIVTTDVSDFVADARNRQDAAERFARIALAREYGRELEWSGPVYRSHTVAGAQVILSFDHVGGGLMAGEKTGLAPVRAAADGRLRLFALAGTDRTWHWADARIDGDTVVVTCAAVPAPVAVRYAWCDNPQPANLYNRDGLPAVPFRTDNW